MEQPVEDRGAARVGEELGLIADQPAGRRMEDEARAAAARGPHLEQLGAALAELLDDDAGMLGVDVDNDLFDRLEQRAVGRAAEDARAACRWSARSPRAASSR